MCTESSGWLCLSSSLAIFCGECMIPVLQHETSALRFLPSQFPFFHESAGVNTLVFIGDLATCA